MRFSGLLPATLSLHLFTQASGCGSPICSAHGPDSLARGEVPGIISGHQTAASPYSSGGGSGGPGRVERPAKPRLGVSDGDVPWQGPPCRNPFPGPGCRCIASCKPQPDGRVEGSVIKHEPWDKRRESTAEASIRPAVGTAFTTSRTETVGPGSKLPAHAGSPGGARRAPRRRIRPSDAPQETLGLHARLPPRRDQGATRAHRAAPRGVHNIAGRPPMWRLAETTRLSIRLRNCAAYGLGRGHRLARPELGHIPLQFRRQIFQDAQLLVPALQG